MRKNAIVIAVVSLIIGAFMVSMLPVQAHHSDRAMKRRITTLERQVAELQSHVVQLEDFIYPCLTTVRGVSQRTGYRAFDNTETVALQWDTSNAPEAFVMLVNPSCVGAAKQVKRVGR